jgi:WD40 repeat protein
MLRWLSFFGAIALVAIGVVYYIHGGPPDTLIRAPQPGEPQNPTHITQEKKAEAQPLQPAQAGPWLGEVAVTPRVVIPGARLTAVYTSSEVPSMQDGQLLFLGRGKLKADETPPPGYVVRPDGWLEPEIKLKPDQQPPPGAIRQKMSYLLIETQPGEMRKSDWEEIDGKSYRPVEKGDKVQPHKLLLRQVDRYFLPIDEGSQVESGDLLGVVDPVLAVDELAIKLAKLDAADADRIASEKIRDYEYEHYERVKALFQRGSGSKEEVAEARAGWERYTQDAISKAEAVKVAARELQQAETNLDLYLIRSKSKGQVKQLHKRRGEAIHKLEALLEMQDHSKLRIRGLVDLQDLANLPDPHTRNISHEVDVEALQYVSPRPHGVLSGHFDAVNGVAVSKDNQIVSVSEDSTARIWQKDLAQGKERLILWHPVAVRAVACTPAQAEKNLCLTGAADGVARLYDLAAQDRAFVREFANGHKAGINCVAFSPDGRWAVTGGDDRAICLWDVGSGDLLQKFPGDWGHKGGVTSVAFLLVGKAKKLSVLSAGRDNAVIVWPLKDDGAPEEAKRLEGRGGEVTTLGVNFDGSQALFDQGKDLRVVSSETRTLVGTMTTTSGNNFTKLALFSPDGKLVLTSTGAGRLQLWRAPTAETRGHELQQLVWTASRDESAATYCGAFAPDGSFLVTGTKNRNVIVWPMPSKEEVERRLKAKIINFDPEVSSGQVKVMAELDNPGYLLPGDVVTLVVYPEKKK